MKKQLVALMMAGLVAAEAFAQGPACRMTEAFRQTDIDAPDGKTPVWADNEGNLMFIERLHVNTDGTKRSYSVEDFWGQRHALNNLCNAMKDLCAGLDEPQLRARRMATQKAEKDGWPGDQLGRTRLSPKIIPMPGGKPCPPFDGYLVSATALHARSVKDECSLDRYVDSLATPAIVIPQNLPGNPSGFSRRGVAVGDLVTAVSIKRKFSVHGVVGDTGPTNKLGEASIAMNGRLLERKGLPVNYREVRGQGEYEGKGWSAPATFILIYARSKDADHPLMSVDRIDPAASDRFSQWGGLDRAQACIDEYRAAKTK